MTEIILEGHFNDADRATSAFPLLPFEVPTGIARLRVHYQVSHQLGGGKAGWQEGNIVDIGLFDPRGAEFLTARGFRGWSGSSRRELFIAADDATPGYLPGPLQPGTWRVVLGLYQLAPEGCDYQVVVTLEKGSGVAEGQKDRGRDEKPSPDAASGPRWYRGDLHAHTWHSDGSAPLADLMAAARTQGLDFVAVTEHNTISHLPMLSAHPTPDLLAIPGVEITTYHGHANVWPVDDFVEFRCQNDDQMAQVREAVRARGALFSINHPKEGGPPWEFGDLFEPDCIEVWGSPWIVSNYQSLAVWDAQLRQGKRITGVGGSDKHQGPFTGELGWYEIGTPCTWVYADALTVQAVVAGLRAGRVFISEGPAGPRLELTAETGGRWAMMGDELRLPPGAELHLCCRVQGGTGSLLRLVSAQETHEVEITSDDFTHERTVAVAGSTYWRAEVIEPPEAPLDEEPAALMAKALGNPVYVKTT
ncbi:MAG: PHP domain-containing protein [Chloroflexi bacterium]|nr:PHP domain-containing protein [Chloroflexota bacterium]